MERKRNNGDYSVTIADHDKSIETGLSKQQRFTANK